VNLFAINGAVINGSAFQRLYATGTVALALAPAGSMVVAKLGRGSLPIQIQPTGAAVVAKQGAGTVPIQIGLDGAATVAQQTSGAMHITLQPSGSAKVAGKAYGAMTITLSGKYDIPASLPVPATYYMAPTTRLIAQAGDERSIRIAADNEIRVRPGNRLGRIPREGRAA